MDDHKMGQIRAMQLEKAWSADHSTMTEISLGAPAVVDKPRVTLRACFLGLVASIGGFMFGYVR